MCSLLWVMLASDHAASTTFFSWNFDVLKGEPPLNTAWLPKLRLPLLPKRNGRRSQSHHFKYFPGIHGIQDQPIGLESGQAVWWKNGPKADGNQVSSSQRQLSALPVGSAPRL